MQRQPDDIHQFLNKVGIVTQFEGGHPMRFQLIGLPDPLHHRAARRQLLGQRAGAPVRRVRRSLLGGQYDNPTGQALAGAGRAATAGRILFDAGQAVLDKPRPPAADSLTISFQRGRNVLVAGAGGCSQHDLGALHKPHGCATSTRPFLQGLALRGAQLNLWGNSHWRESSSKEENTATAY
jgi:hypothetical protein